VNDPIQLFRDWQRESAASNAAHQPNAMCVSTVDAAGAPHARFVDLKVVRPDGFVFCTSYASPKGVHLEANPNVALTFWWDHIGRQVRVLGVASRIADSEADAYFAERSRNAQLASWAFEQSDALRADETRADRVAAAREKFGADRIPRPPEWGGYLVTPRRIEFLRFDVSRAHERVLYEVNGSGWRRSELQP
jgi:pyridoxamine 5'-phosphate oxidase